MLGETHSDCPTLLAECAAAEGVEVEAAVAAAKAPAVAVAVAAAAAEAAPVALKPDRIAHDFYQSADYATVTILLKKAKKEDVTVDFGPASLSVTIKLPTGADYNLELDLCHTIVPEMFVVTTHHPLRFFFLCGSLEDTHGPLRIVLSNYTMTHHYDSSL